MTAVSRCLPRPRLAAPAFVAGIAAACLLLAFGPARAESLTGRVDHDFMNARETFDYVLSLSGGDSSEPPDLAPLTRDFDILDRGRRSRVDGSSGRPVEVNDWVITLAPKRTGSLTVPKLTLAGFSTQPLSIEVVPALPVDQPENEPLYVRVDVGDVSPYAQSLVPVVVRIFDSLGLRQGRLSPPTAEGAVLTEDGAQRTYVKTVGGRRYGVVEQSFLMQPQRSGTIEINPVTVEASVPGRSNPAASALPNLLGRSALTVLNYQDVTIRSRPVSVAIKPRPEGIAGWFLPARGVSLAQDWSPGQDKAQVGVVLTRTLRLTARGASPNQLPPIPLGEVDGVRQYADDSASERIMVDGIMGAELTKTISVVPTRPGPVTLPAITVDWWNTQENRAARTELPAVILNVAPAAGIAPSAVSAAGGDAPSGATLSAEGGGAIEDLLARLQEPPWLASLAAALVAGLAAAALWWRRARRRGTPAPSASPSATPRWSAAPGPRRRMAMGAQQTFATAAAAEKALVRACRANDADGAHAAFLAWLRLSAGTGGERFHAPKMDQAVQALSAALYGDQPEPWRGRDFLSAFRAEKRARGSSGRGGRRGRIAPLYPMG